MSNRKENAQGTNPRPSTAKKVMNFLSTALEVGAAAIHQRIQESERDDLEEMSRLAAAHAASLSDAVKSVMGFHNVSYTDGKQFLVPYRGVNGFYILCPSRSGTDITILVTNNNDFIQYHLHCDPLKDKFFIYPDKTFRNIQDLLAYYMTKPISPDINTLLLFPVTEQLLLDEFEVVDVNYYAATAEEDSWHFLNSKIGAIMTQYLDTEGWYLVRDNSDGGRTLAVTHRGSISYLKIHNRGNQFYITPDKCFNSVQALLEHYKTSPIRSEKDRNMEILLTNPIPVEKKRKDAFKKDLEETLAGRWLSRSSPSEPLPEPWEEYCDERSDRYHYHNHQTSETTWERPNLQSSKQFDTVNKEKPPVSLPKPVLSNSYRRLRSPCEWKSPPANVSHSLRYTRSSEDVRKEQEHLAAIQEAIDKHGTFGHSIVRGIFIGPARSGKDTLMKRLLREMPLKKSPSTGVADRVVHIKVEKSSSSSSFMANIKESAWKPIKTNDHDEAIDIMLKIASTRTTSTRTTCKEISTTSTVQSKIAKFNTEHSVDIIDRHQSFSEPEYRGKSTGVNIASQPPTSTSPLEVFKTAVQTQGLKGHEEHLDTQVSLYLTNTGGQMEFQELLPLLVSGPSMFFLTFRLDRDLNTPYKIVYEIDVQSGYGSQLKSYKYISSNTPLDTILQSLASIDAIGTYTDYKKKNIALKYRILLIGTHRDILEKRTSNAESAIAKINKEIKNAVETATYWKHIIHADEDHLIFTVNNFAKDDKDFQLIRSSVQKVVEAGDFRDDYPSYWLIYSLMLQRLGKRTESFKKCFEVAKSCGIIEENELKEALYFLDRRMGVIRYFPEDKLKNLVILDPQVLFDKVTQLIVETFTFEHCFLDRSVEEEFKKGIFSLKEFERINKKINPDSTINPKWFADLLQHLRIAAPFKEAGIQKYFFPIAISHVAEKQKVNIAKTELIICPLVVLFKCGYCPIGLTGGLITYIMEHKVNSGEWEFRTNGIFRDQVTYVVCDTNDEVTLKSFPTHLEITCIPGPGNRDKYPVEGTCIEVKRLFKKGIEIVTRDMNYVRNVDTKFTFYCTAEKCKESRKHPAKHVEATGKLHCIKDNSSTFDLPKGHHYWMVSSGQGKARYRPPRPPSHPPENETFDRAEDIPDTRTHQLLPLKQAFKTLIPLAYRWYNIGTLLEITDGKLKSIECDKRDTYDCLREMLSSWLKQVDPPPTWSGLAEAVEHFDPSIAEKIRNF